LELKEVREESQMAWDVLYDFLNDTINFPTASSDDAGGTPEG
jgi:hypothetical protein